jgi:protocatechuate 3,4-dioxygenase, alpha subunit
MTEALGLTPSQTAGPYLSIGLLRDLVPTALVDRDDPGAIRIRGLLVDGAGEGVGDGMVEIWQADEAGRYGTEAFPGFGRSGTDGNGRFEFVTVKPGRVPWPDGGLQAPHVAVGVLARGLLKRVVTRLYFPDEPEANAADPVLAALSPSQRETLIAMPDDDGLRFDIRLQGASQTTFFAV